jgi:hypothetical protein
MATLSDLPTEILDAIVSLICRDLATGPCLGTCQHSDSDPPPVLPPQGRPSEDNSQRFAALRALCLTSRRLNVVALPHLYHHVEASQHRWWLLGNTLVARPDLADNVRSFYFAARSGDCPGSRKKNKEATRDRRLRAAFLRRRQAYLDTLPYEPGQNWSWISLNSLQRGDRNLHLDLLLSLLPNLETLKFHLNYGRSFRFCTPGSLPRLRHIDASFTDGDWQFDETLSDGEITNLAPLLRAARDSLESMVLRGPVSIFPLLTRDRIGRRQKLLLEYLEQRGAFDDVDSDYDDRKDDRWPPDTTWMQNMEAASLVDEGPGESHGVVVEKSGVEDTADEDIAYYNTYYDIEEAEKGSELDGQLTLPRLRRLAIINGGFRPDHDLIWLLKACPNLTHLYLRLPHTSDMFEWVYTPLGQVQPSFIRLAKQLKLFVFYACPNWRKGTWEEAERIRNALVTCGIECIIRPAKHNELVEKGIDDNKVLASWIPDMP